MGQEILFNGGERISMDGENMSQYQNQMGAANGYDRNYASDPQLGHFSPNFHNLPSFSGQHVNAVPGHHDGIQMILHVSSNGDSCDSSKLPSKSSTRFQQYA